MTIEMSDQPEGKHTTDIPVLFPNALDNLSIGPSIKYRIGPQDYTDRDVDHWELKASRRALANLKALLYGQPMLDLIHAQCRQGDTYIKSLLAASEGQWNECRTDMDIVGVSLREVMAARKKLLTLSEKEAALRTLLPAHPEHYAKSTAAGQEGVVEVVGGHMMDLRMDVTAEVPDFVNIYADKAYPMKKPTIVRLRDGTAAYYILHEFADVESGCKLRLRVVFPAAAPLQMFKEHAEHMAIEFRFGIRTLYAGLF